MRMRSIQIWLALLACGLLCASVLMASQDVPSEVASDRPSVSNSTQTVPVGALQIELGLEYARSSVTDGPAEHRLATQATLRAGLTDRFEARVEGEPLVRLRQEQDDTGPGDVALGVKYRFFDPLEGRRWPSLSIEPFVKLPVAEAPIGSERTDFGVLVLASQDLPWQLSLDVNAGLVAVGQVQPRGYLMQPSLRHRFHARLEDACPPLLSCSSPREKSRRDARRLAWTPG